MTVENVNSFECTTETLDTFEGLDLEKVLVMRLHYKTWVSIFNF